MLRLLARRTGESALQNWARVAQPTSDAHRDTGSRAGTAAAAGAAALMSLLGWASSSALADSAQAQGANEQAKPVLIVLPGGAKVEVMTPATGDWQIKLEKAKPKGGLPQAIELDGQFSVPPPPYALHALEPHMSQSTLEYHWGKHHRTYCENLNKQVVGTTLEGKSLEEVVLAAWNGGKPQPAFNNAAQVWNHTFFWESMKAQGGGAPAEGPLADAIQRDFGGLENLRKELQAAGLTQFGSGWAWLVCDSEGNLKVLKTANAVTPIVTGWTALLTIDVWEHAYYLDHQNKRADYISIFLDHLVDWEKVADRYSKAI